MVTFCMDLTLRFIKTLNFALILFRVGENNMYFSYRFYRRIAKFKIIRLTILYSLAVPEDPRCKGYSQELCSLPWMRKNCPQKCSTSAKPTELPASSTSTTRMYNKIHLNIYFP